MKVSASCFAVTGLAFIPPWSVNAGFAVGKMKTLVIDSGANLLSAQTIYGYASNMKPHNTMILINTEYHFDHMGGNAYFRDKGIPIYGHHDSVRNEQGLIAMIDEYNQCIPNAVRQKLGEARIFFAGTSIVGPERPVFQDTLMDLGGLEARILLSPGHTHTNLSVFIPSEKMLFCGDCIVNGYLPNLESGTVNDWENWLRSLDKLKALGAEVIVPGHGQILQGEQIEQAIEDTRRVLETAIKIGIPPTLE